MTRPEAQYLQLGLPNGGRGQQRRIAYRIDGDPQAAGARVLWLSGFLSDMASTKATVLAEWAAARKVCLLRFDYSGHGISSGEVAEGSIGDWLEEASAALDLLGHGPTFVVGSSMGGWIALLLALKLRNGLPSGTESPGQPGRLAGMTLIAPAWDMTEALMWRRLPETARGEIENKGIYHQPSEYGDSYPITSWLIEEGRNHLLEGRSFDPGCPVRILQGMEDPDVPWRHSLALVERMSAADVELDLIKDGDHRLSRPQDLSRLTRTLDGLLELYEAPAQAS